MGLYLSEPSDTAASELLRDMDNTGNWVATHTAYSPKLRELRSIQPEEIDADKWTVARLLHTALDAGQDSKTRLAALDAVVQRFEADHAEAISAAVDKMMAAA